MRMLAQMVREQPRDAVRFGMKIEVRTHEGPVYELITQARRL